MNIEFEVTDPSYTPELFSFDQLGLNVFYLRFWQNDEPDVVLPIMVGSEKYIVIFEMNNCGGIQYMESQKSFSTKEKVFTRLTEQTVKFKLSTAELTYRL